MKKFKYLIGLALLAVTAGFTSCQDDVDDPAMNIPVATKEANTSIKELKEKYWQDAVNYIDTIETRDDGSHVIIKGRVVSSDEASNVFKNLVIQDETGALTLSIDSYNLYLNYRVGQEIVIDATGMYIGKYAGLMQLGMPSAYLGGWQASFMSREFFTVHTELNGTPEPEKIDTIVIDSFDELVKNKESFIKNQSQFVRFNNVKFVNGGNATFSTYHANGNQDLVDGEGNGADNTILTVRTSGYSNFWNKTLPAGYGDICGILSFYDNGSSSNWQLILNKYEDVMNFGNPTLPEGTKDTPYTVEEVIAFEAAGAAKEAWMTGYIVGAVAPEVTTVSSNADIEWGAPTTLNNTLVIASAADVKDFTKCVVVELPQGSSLREEGNLRDNVENLGKQIWLKGRFEKVLGMAGVAGNNGSSSEYEIEGKAPETPVEGNGSKEAPYNVDQVFAQGVGATGVWIKGYIVGFIPDKAIADAKFSASGAVKTNIILAASADVTDVAKCIPVQLPSGAVRTGVNLADHPENYGAEISLCGDIATYFGVTGFKNTSEYVLGAGGQTPPVIPTDPVSGINENFEGGAVPAGWTQVNIAGDKDWWARQFDNNYYITMSGYNGKAPFDQWLVTPPVDMSKVTDKKLSFRTQVNGYGSTTTKFEVYVMTAADTKGDNTKLNPVIATAPADGYSEWAQSGDLDLSAYSGVVYIGFRYSATEDANYATWCVDDVVLGAATSGGGDDPTPPTPGEDGKGSFNTFNGGTIKAQYGTYTNATGWTATNCQIIGGSDKGTNSNPNFAFISDSPTTLAVLLNGKVSAPGSLLSPSLAGGIKTLTFNYGFPYTDTKAQLTINVKQNDSVVATKVLSVTSAKFEANSFSWDVNVSGDFVIEIVNDCLSGVDSNKDRVAIWNLDWTN